MGWEEQGGGVSDLRCRQRRALGFSPARNEPPEGAAQVVAKPLLLLALVLGVVGGWAGSFWGAEVGVFSPGWAVNEELFQARGNGAAGAVFSIPSTSFLCASLAFVVFFLFVFVLFWVFFGWVFTW